MSDKVFSMPVERATRELLDSEKQLEIVSDFLLDELVSNGSKWIIESLCESYCLNKKIADQFEDMLIYSEIIPAKDNPNQEEIVVPNDVLPFLEAALIARYYLNKELSKRNISLSLH